MMNFLYPHSNYSAPSPDKGRAGAGFKKIPHEQGSTRGKGIKKKAGESQTSLDYLKGGDEPKQALRLYEQLIIGFVNEM